MRGDCRPHCGAPGHAPVTDAVATGQKLLRQQAAIARFGGFALREPDLTKILTEAARACADGLGVPFSQVWQYRAEKNDLVVAAGHGWLDEVVGHAVSCDDMRSLQGRAFTTGETSIAGDLQNGNGCGLPPFYAAHDIVSIVDVIIQDDGDQPYGILEVGADRPRATKSNWPWSIWPRWGPDTFSLAAAGA